MPNIFGTTGIIEFYGIKSNLANAALAKLGFSLSRSGIYYKGKSFIILEEYLKDAYIMCTCYLEGEGADGIDILSDKLSAVFDCDTSLTASFPRGIVELDSLEDTYSNEANASVPNQNRLLN